MADAMERARDYFREKTGVDIAGHGTLTGGGRLRLKPEDVELLANALTVESAADEDRTGFTMPMEDLKLPGSVSLVPYAIAEPHYCCTACGKAVKIEGGTSAIVRPGQRASDMKWLHVRDGTPPCPDWVGAVVRETEWRLRQFDREGRDRGLPGPLQRDPSEPIIVEVTWCRSTGTN